MHATQLGRRDEPLRIMPEEQDRRNRGLRIVEQVQMGQDIGRWGSFGKRELPFMASA
jgi:hypothetical protein